MVAPVVPYPIETYERMLERHRRCAPEPWWVALVPIALFLLVLLGPVLLARVAFGQIPIPLDGASPPGATGPGEPASVVRWIKDGARFDAAEEGGVAGWYRGAGGRELGITATAAPIAAGADINSRAQDGNAASALVTRRGHVPAIRVRTVRRERSQAPS